MKNDKVSAEPQKQEAIRFINETLKTVFNQETSRKTVSRAADQLLASMPKHTRGRELRIAS